MYPLSEKKESFRRVDMFRFDPLRDPYAVSSGAWGVAGAGVPVEQFVLCKARAWWPMRRELGE